jgi:hypothetical protein
VTFADSGDGRQKRIAKAHQYFAVSKAVDKTVEATRSNGKAGVVWHTQGSGKSMEMELPTLHQDADAAGLPPSRRGTSSVRPKRPGDPVSDQLTDDEIRELAAVFHSPVSAARLLDASRLPQRARRTTTEAENTHTEPAAPASSAPLPVVHPHEKPIISPTGCWPPSCTTG